MPSSGFWPRRNETELMAAIRHDIGPHDSRWRRTVKTPGCLTILGVEHGIRVNGERIGVADIIGRCRGAGILIEVKSTSGSSAFWDATKILAYAKIAEETEGKKYIPGVIVPQDSICINTMVAATVLKIRLFGYYYDEDAKKFFITDARTGRWY